MNVVRFARIIFFALVFSAIILAAVLWLTAPRPKIKAPTQSMCSAFPVGMTRDAVQVVLVQSGASYSLVLRGQQLDVNDAQSSCKLLLDENQRIVRVEWSNKETDFIGGVR